MERNEFRSGAAQTARSRARLRRRPVPRNPCFRRSSRRLEKARIFQIHKSRPSFADVADLGPWRNVVRIPRLVAGSFESTLPRRGDGRPPRPSADIPPIIAGCAAVIVDMLPIQNRCLRNGFYSTKGRGDQSEPPVEHGHSRSGNREDPTRQGSVDHRRAARHHVLDQ